MKRNYISFVCVNFRFYNSYLVSLLYFYLIESNYSCRDCSLQLSCFQRESIVFLYALACPSQVLFSLLLFSTSDWIQLFLEMRSWVRRSFSEFKAQFQRVNSLTFGSSPRIGLPFIDIYNQKLLTPIYLAKIIIHLPIMLSNKATYLLGQFRRTCQNKWSFRSLVAMRSFSTSQQSLISNMSEIKEANRCFQQKNFPQTIEFLERSLSILPFYIKDNYTYNQQFEQIANTYRILYQSLVKSYAWKGEKLKIEYLIKRIIKQSRKVDVKIGGKIKQIYNTLSIIEKTEDVLYNHLKHLIKNTQSKIPSQFNQKNLLFPRQLIKPFKGEEKSIIDIQPFIHSELRSSIAFIFTSLILQPNFSTNPLYNKLCNTLLKNAQKSSHKNIIKPLTILVTNLVRNNQFLQAEGMIKYCLDRKSDNLKLNLLKKNQEYILLQLLLGFTYEGVDRKEECNRILQQYSNLFNLETYLLQHYLIDSI